MIKNYYYLVVGILAVLFAVTHAFNGQTAVIPKVNAGISDVNLRTVLFYVWHIITIENLIFGVAFLSMSFYKDLSKVKFAAVMIGVIMVARWLVISGSTLVKNKSALGDILTDTIAIAVTVVLIILGTRVKNKILVESKHHLR